MLKSSKVGLVGLFAATILFPSRVASQTCGGAFNESLDHIGRYFFSDDLEAFRTAVGVQKLQPGATAEVVTDSQLCRKVEREVNKWLRGQPIEQEIANNGWDFSILRYGPYVTMYFAPRSANQADSLPPPAGQTIELGPGVLLIYEEAGNKLNFVGGGLV